MFRLHESWKHLLQSEFDALYMAKLLKFLIAERDNGKTFFPPESDWFHALSSTPLAKVRVVILGQDPYHGEGQAHGLSFSVPRGVRIPPSLSNIFRELNTDLNILPSLHGNLESWSERGVLLLNSVLTVEAGIAASHKGRGWERFTDAIIHLVNNQPKPVVFILWGNYAQKKAGFIDESRHLVLRAAHPSPLSAHHGFFGSKPFSQANKFLLQSGQAAIQWALPN